MSLWWLQHQASIGTVAAGAGAGAGSQADTYAVAVLALSPVAFYKMDESGGSTMTDSSTTGNHGTYVNAPTLGGAGPIAGATGVAFNGSTQYASAPYSSALDFTDAEDVSMALWLKIPTWPAAEAWLIGRTGDGYDNDYELKTHTTPVLRGRHLGTEVASDGIVDIDDAAYHFWVRSVDRNGNCVDYVDAVEDGTTDVSTLATAWNRNTPFYIARRATAGYIAASICQVAIFPSALSSGQVSGLYTAAGF